MRLLVICALMGCVASAMTRGRDGFRPVGKRSNDFCTFYPRDPYCTGSRKRNAEINPNLAAARTGFRPSKRDAKSECKREAQGCVLQPRWEPTPPGPQVKNWYCDMFPDNELCKKRSNKPEAPNDFCTFYPRDPYCTGSRMRNAEINPNLAAARHGFRPSKRDAKPEGKREALQPSPPWEHPPIVPNDFAVRHKRSIEKREAKKDWNCIRFPLNRGCKFWNKREARVSLCQHNPTRPKCKRDKRDASADPFCGDSNLPACKGWKREAKADPNFAVGRTNFRPGKRDAKPKREDVVSFPRWLKPVRQPDCDPFEAGCNPLKKREAELIPDCEIDPHAPWCKQPSGVVVKHDAASPPDYGDYGDYGGDEGRDLPVKREAELDVLCGIVPDHHLCRDREWRRSARKRDAASDDGDEEGVIYLCRDNPDHELCHPPY